MKFKVGDKVKVISLNKVEELCPKPWTGLTYIFFSKVEGCSFTHEMLEFCGLVGTITDVWFADDGTYRYSLSFEDGRKPSWSWVSEFFETFYVTCFEEAYINEFSNW
jgi:hypothetical protein